MTQPTDPRISAIEARYSVSKKWPESDAAFEDMRDLATTLASELSQERHIYADMNTQRHEVLDECDRLRAELSASQAELEQARRAHLDEVALANTALAKCGHCYKCGGSGEAAEFDGRPVTCSECHGAGNTRGGQMLSSERARREGLEQLLAELVRTRHSAADDADGRGLTWRVHAEQWEKVTTALRDAPSPTAAVVASSATGETAEKCEQCPGCARQPHEVNHPPGMVFVGWGTGWQPCPRCNGTSKNPPEPAEDPSDEELRGLDWKAHETARDETYRSSPGGIDYDIVWRAVRRALFNAGREFERKARR